MGVHVTIYVKAFMGDGVLNNIATLYQSQGYTVQNESGDGRGHRGVVVAEFEAVSQRN
jgi:hypothetical protein